MFCIVTVVREKKKTENHCPTVPAKVRDFSLLQIVQTGSGAYPVSYSMGSGVLFPV